MTLLIGCRPAALAPVVLARGTLAYAVVWDDSDHLWSIELDERFALIERAGPNLAPIRRIDLGPAEINIYALAVSSDEVYVGRNDGWIEARAHTGVLRARWPQGAAIADIAVVGAMLLSLDVGGVLCMRRRADGALLHCRVLVEGWKAELGASRLAAHPSAVDVVTPSRRWRVEVPTMRATAAAAAAGVTEPSAFRFDAKATDIARSHRGIVAAGWVRDLGSPSIVWWPSGPKSSSTRVCP